jgi:NADP-dependent 3-hydroxy acid dehydrogenase YdfG
MKLSKELNQVADKIRDAKQFDIVDEMFIATLPNRLEAMAKKAEGLETEAGMSKVSAEIHELSLQIKKGIKGKFPSNSNDFNNGGDAA